MDALYDSKLSLVLINKGKVRDIYSIDDNTMLIVTSDRLSAFDVVLTEPIAQKGAVLTSISNFWFHKTKHIINNHLLDIPVTDILPKNQAKQVESRAIVVQKLKPLPIEAIVRGYLIGSGWKDYQKSGSVSGIKLAKNLKLAEQLPEAIYTPSTKASIGEHDENISYEDSINLLGADLAKQVKDISLQLYKYAAKYALEKGVIIADTKFEFGLDSKNNLTLMDEVLTPDSSRFWAKSTYKIGTSPKSFDKQIVRDYLESCDWDKNPPAPKLPDKISAKTTAKYLEVAKLLCQ